MKKIRKWLSVLLLTSFSMWGCAQGTSNYPGRTAANDRVRELEVKCTQLEKDYQSVAKTRDQMVQQMATLEQERGALQTERTMLTEEVEKLKLVARERDKLRQDIEVRTTERDVLQGRCDKMKKGLQSLLGQDDAALQSTGTPVTSTTLTVGGNS